jgi:oligoribonuclease
MLYVSVDVETSGLDPLKNQVLSIGAIIEDTKTKLPFQECPKFHAMVVHNEIVGSPRALTINRDLLSVMAEYLESSGEDRFNMETHSEFLFTTMDDVVKSFYDFLFVNGYGYDTITGGLTVRIVNGRPLPSFGGKIKPITINVAGKNFGTFDKLFLEQLPWWQKLIRIRQRVIDPSIQFCDWENDETLPNLYTCKQRAGIEGIVTHNALEDAWDVIELLRKSY